MKLAIKTIRYCRVQKVQEVREVREVYQYNEFFLTSSCMRNTLL